MSNADQEHEAILKQEKISKMKKRYSQQLQKHKENFQKNYKRKAKRDNQ